VSTPSVLGFRSGCPYRVFAADLDAVRGVSEIENELLLIATSKVKYVEFDYKKISDRLVGIKFTMDDRRITAKEDEEKVRQVESDLERAAKAVSEMELQVGFSVFYLGLHTFSCVDINFVGFRVGFLERVFLVYELSPLTFAVLSLCAG